MDWLVIVIAGFVGFFWIGGLNQPHTGAKLASWTMVLSSVVSIGEASLWPLVVGWLITWVLKLIFGDPSS